MTKAIEKAKKQLTLEKLLDRRGINQYELAEKLGVTPQAVSKWIVGKCLPDADRIIKIEKACACTADLRKFCAGVLAFNLID